MIKYYKTLIVFMALLSSIITSAQTGPGGVGNANGTNGQPENVMWFAADSLNLNNGDPVSSWPDISGNGNNAEQVLVASQPTFTTGEINGLPAIVFDGTDDFLPFDGSQISNSDYTVIFVGERRSSNSFKVFMGGTTTASNRNLHLYWFNSTQFRAHHYGNDLQTDMVDNSLSYSSGTDANEYGAFGTLLASSEGSNQRRNYQNNVHLGSRSVATQLSDYIGSAIGRYTTGYHDVNAAEVIFYSSALNDAQLQVVYQYLNIKYGININNDLYSPSAAYAYNVAGVGEEANGENTLASSAGLYLETLTGTGIGDYVFTSHNNATNNTSTLSTSDLGASGAVKRYNRIWYIKEVNTPEVRLSFDFQEAMTDADYPANATNYVLLFRSGTSGNFSKVQNADGSQNGDQVYFDLTSAELQDGYYTLGTEDDTNSPLEGVAGKKWFSLISGDWDNWETWTLDPSGALPNNPDQVTPTTSATSTIDEVTILSGRSITVQSGNNNKANVKLTVNGELDLTATTGHIFSEIAGSGRIILGADNFPEGDATNFVTEGLGEGTVVYEGSGYTLSNLDSYEFFNMQIDLDNSTDELVLIKDLQINGDLLVDTGALQINNDVLTNIINITVQGDIDISEAGSLLTGTGDVRTGYQIGGTMPIDDGKEYQSIFHQLIINGNFTNRGTVKLTNQNAPDYNDFPTNGAVTLRMEGASNTQILCYGITNVYNLVIDKGVDKTYIMNLFTDDITHFNLFGANSVGRSTSLGYSAENPLIRKALFIKNGTLKLTGNIIIPTLSEGNEEGGNGDYAVGQNSSLWLAGVDVTVYSTANDVDQITGFTSGDTYTANGVNTGSSNQAMSVYGQFRISDGTFGTRNSAGFIFWSDASAQVKIDGGSSSVAQIRSAGGGTGVASYVQTAGTITVFGNEGPNGGEYTGAYPLFGLESTDAVFQMSGGDIILQDDDGDADPEFYIPSSDGNYSVTGGKLTFQLTNGRTAQLSSTANLWDFEIENTTGSGNTTVELLTDLDVNQDFTLNPYCTFEVNDPGSGTDHNVNIGRNFSILEDGTTKNIGIYNYRTNTTTFDGTEDGEFYVGWNHNDGHEQLLYDITVNKTEGKKITVIGDTNKDPDNVTSEYFNRLVHVVNDANIISGILDQGRQSIRLFEGVNVEKKGQLGTYENGVTPLTAYIMFRDGDLTINSEDGVTFGNIKFNSTGTVTFTSDVYIKRIGYYRGMYNIGTHNLKVDYLHKNGTSTNFSTNNGSATKMIYTDVNSSDGGLSLLITGNGNYAWPLGTKTTTTRYTPTKITVSNFSDDGYITVNPVDEQLSTTNQSGGDLLDYYFRVRHSDFDAVPNAIHYFTYDESDVVGIENNYYSGRVLGYYPYTRNYINNINRVDKTNNIITYDDGAGGAIPLEEANYTAGESNRFTGNVEVFFNKRNNQGTWDDTNDWFMDADETVAATTVPGTGDVVIIRGDYFTDNITVNGTREAAEIVFIREGSYVDIESMPRLRVGTTDVLTVDRISGVGDIYLQRTTAGGATLNADIGDFASNDTSVVEFYTTQDGTYDVAAVDFFTVLPTLRIYGQNSTSRDVRFNYDMDMKNLVIDGSAKLLVGGNYTVQKRTRLGFTGDGRIEFPNSATSYTFSTGEFVTGKGKAQGSDNYELTVASGINTDLTEHIFEVQEDIDLDFSNYGGTVNIDLNTSQAETNVILKLSGEGDHTFVNGYTDANSTIELYKIYMDKGSDQSSTFSFNSNFDLLGSTAGVGIDKAITLQNGTLILNHPDINVNLNTGGDKFNIPSTSALEIRDGLANVENGSGIYLDGKLLISGGTLDMGDDENFIEYSASGNAELVITSGTLDVGAQVRRGLISEEGILQYNQSGGNVEIGSFGGPENNRGIFEILNAGSNFEMSSGATFTIANAQDNPTFSSVYLMPESYNLEAGTSIQFGTTNTKGSQVIGLRSSIPLQNITLDNSNGSDPDVLVEIANIDIDGDITIANNTTLNADGWDINLAGDFTNNGGTFTAGSNTVIFDDAALQTITGETTFYNLSRTGGAELQTFDNITVENIFDMASGTFTDNDNTLTVQGNINFGGTHAWGGSSNGIYLNGTSEQIMTGAGTYDRLTINNASGVSIDAGSGSDISIVDELQLNEGIFDIDQYLLYLQSSAEITTTATFDANTLIQTNISFTDAGILKDFPAIASTTAYEIPVGVEGKYTPIALSIDAVDAGGSIRFKAANEMQPTINDDSDECHAFNDLLNVLQYHWILEATNISNFTADMTMEYDPADALYDNTWGYDLTDYIAARILTYGTGADLNTWNKYDETNVDEGNNQLTFSFAGTNSDGISGDYTAGVEQTDAGGCNGAIPNTVTEFITLNASSSWTDPNDWAVYDSEADTHGAAGVGVPASGPRGAIIYVADNQTLTIPSNYVSAYKTFINAGATLDIGTTFGHRLGIVSGTGTLYLERGDLPAGIYDDFFSTTGGTLEYGGSNVLNVMGGLSEVNNVIFSGSNVRWFPNNNVTINGNLEVNGAVIAAFNDKVFSIRGDFIRTSGYCRLGYSSSSKNTIKFIGTDDQTISGNIYSTSSSIKNIEINKTAGSLSITGRIQLNGNLTLTQGNINTTGQNLYLSDASSALDFSSSSYINGPLYKNLNSSTDFTFPIGKDDIYRPIGVVNPTDDALWMAVYDSTNSTTDLGSGLATVSSNDSWTLSDVNNIHPHAKIKLYWGTETNVSPTAADHADLRVVYKDGTGTWQTLGNSSYAGDVNSGWLVSTNQASFSTVEFSIASSTPANPLPVTLIDFTARVQNNNQVALSWKTTTEINNDYFIIERSRDGVVFDEVERVSGNGTSSQMTAYQSTDYDPYTGISYYRLRQVDYDGQEDVFPMVAVEIESMFNEEPQLNIHPNPYRGGNLVVDIAGFDEQEEALVMISDISGHGVWQGRVYPSHNEMSKVVNEQLEKANPGFYLVIVVSKDKRISSRVIKE